MNDNLGMRDVSLSRAIETNHAFGLKRSGGDGDRSVGVTGGSWAEAGNTMDNSTEVRAAIMKVIEAEDAAWKAGDADAFCEAATPDVVFTNIVGMFSVGHAPMVAQHARIFSTIYQGSTLKQEITNLKMVRPDVAIVETQTTVSDFKALPPGSQAINGKLTTRLEQVMVMENRRWRVAAFHNVTVNPAATSGPPK